MSEGGAQFSSGEVPIRSSTSHEQNKPLTPIRSSSPDNSQLGVPIRTSEKQPTSASASNSNLSAQLGSPIRSSDSAHATLENLAQGVVTQTGSQPENTLNVPTVPQTTAETTIGEQTSMQENPIIPQREQWQIDMEPEIIQNVVSRGQYMEAVAALRRDRLALQDIEDIVHGQLRGMPLQLNPVGREGTANYSEFQWIQRLQLIEQYRKSPALALAIVQRHIALGHGGSSASLLGFLDPEHGGLRTRAYLAENNIARATGEEGRATLTNSTHINDIAVSFEAWYEPETLINYANGNVGGKNYMGEVLPNRRRPITEQSLTESITRHQQELQVTTDESEQRRLQARIDNASRTRELIRTRPEDPLIQLLQANVPTIYLVRGEAVQRRIGTDPGNIVMFNSMSDTEVGIRGGVSRENTGIVLVPRNEVARVQQIFSQRDVDIAVFPIEDYAHA